jgi:hypothetical protein
MTNYRLLNAIRDIQVASKECDLYAGSIDGKWGNGSATAVATLFKDYNYRINGSRAEASPLPWVKVVNEDGALKNIQSNLKLLKLYDGQCDGIMGPGTWNAFSKVVSSYKAYNRVPYLGIGWSKKVSKVFVEKVIAWCKKHELWDNAPSALMACINFETGGTFSPTIRNGAGAYYFGLIQFGKDAALDLSRVYKDPRVTVEWLITLSAEEQLDWVFKYFEMWMKRGKKYNRLEDFYLTIFYPAAVGKKPDEVIFSKDVEKERLGYTQNKGFDFDKDGRITVGEINTRLYTSYYDGMLASNRSPSSAHY